MIIGKPAPKSNSSLLKELGLWQGAWGIYSAFFETQLSGKRENASVCAWPCLNPAHLRVLRHPRASGCPGECLSMNALEIFLFSLEYGTGSAFHFSSYLFCNISVYLCWQTNLQRSAMALHASWQVARPPSAPWSTLVTAWDKTSSLEGILSAL